MGDELVPTKVRLQIAIGYLITAVGPAAVALSLCLVRAVIWSYTSLLRLWLRTPDSGDYLRDMFRSEAVSQLGVAGFDPKRPYRLLGQACDLLKEMMLGG